MSNEKKAFSIAENVRGMANELKERLTYDDTGTGQFDGAEDVFVKYLPEGLTLDNVKSVQETLLDYSAAQTLAQGEKSQELLTNNRDLQSTSVKSRIGYSSVESSYKRETHGVVKDKPWRKYGVASTDVVLGTGRKSTTYRDIVTHLGDEAEKVFCN